MTYLEAAMDIIEMYNNYAIKCAHKGTSCGDHSESVALAVEALSIVANMRTKTPTEEIEDALDKHIAEEGV